MSTAFENAKLELSNLLVDGGRGHITPEKLRLALVGTIDAAFSDLTVIATSAYDEIHSLYLGQFASDPTGSIHDGAEYFNTDLNKFRVYSDGAWMDYDASAQAAKVAAVGAAAAAAASAGISTSAAASTASAVTTTTAQAVIATAGATTATAAASMTASDRVQTGLDRTATTNSATDAANSATATAADRAAAAGSATTAATSAVTAQAAQQSAAAIQAAITAGAAASNTLIEDLYDAAGNYIAAALVDANYNAWWWLDAAGQFNWTGQTDTSALSNFDFVTDDPDWHVAFVGADGRSIIGGFRSALTTTPGLPPPLAWYFYGAAGSSSSSSSRYPDILHEVLHGQSLGEADEAYSSANGGLTGITITDQGWGTKRFSRGFNTWSGLDNPQTPASRASNGFDLVTAANGQTESSIAGAGDHLKARLSSRYATVDQSAASPLILGSFGARGSTRLSGINKRDSTGSTPIGTSSTSLTVATGAKTLTVPTGMLASDGTALAAGAPIGLISTANAAIYMAGTVTSYAATTLDVNITSIQGSGTLAAWSLVNDNWQLPGGYYATALDDVARAKAAAVALNKSYAVSWVRWMQGERNGDYRVFEGSTATLSLTAAVADYQTRLLLLAGDFDADIRAISGQKRRVPMLCYQTNGFPAAEAQLRAQATSPDIYMIGPHYAVPSALNNANFTNGTWRWGSDIHLSADGQRWYGEQSAKVGHRVLFENERWRPLSPLAARKVDSLTLDVDFNVPRAPLVIDTAWFAKLQGWGFAVFNGSLDSQTNVQRPTSCTLLGPTTVRFGFATAIPAGAIFGTVPTSTYDLGIAAPVVASVGAASNATLGGYARYTLTIAGDITAALAPLINEGAFRISSGSKSAVIRNVALIGGNTVLTGESRESATAFAASDALTFGGSFSRTNLRDSDTDASINTFGDATFGTRAGQSYPMWNWCVLFAGITVAGA